MSVSVASNGSEPTEGSGRHPGVWRVLVVEDHPALRETLVIVLKREDNFKVAGQAGSLTEASKVLGEGRVDLAVVDLNLPDGDGVQIVEKLRRANPEAKALVLTAITDRAEWGRAVEAGAAAVLEKSSPLALIVDALRRLAAGEELTSREDVLELLSLHTRKREEERMVLFAASRLTSREKEVLQALAEGLYDDQIARRLGVKPETVHAHLVKIYAKLGVHSRVSAATFALRHGLAKPREGY